MTNIKIPARKTVARKAITTYHQLPQAKIRILSTKYLQANKFIATEKT